MIYLHKLLRTFTEKKLPRKIFFSNFTAKNDALKNDNLKKNMVLKVFKLSLVNLQARLMSVSISSNTKLSITDNVRSKASNMHKVLTHTTDPHRQPAVRRADRLFSSHHPCYPPVPADLRSGSVLKTQKSHCIHFTSNMKHCNKSKNDRKALLQKKRNSKKCREKKRKARARAILLRPY